MVKVKRLFCFCLLGLLVVSLIVCCFSVQVNASDTLYEYNNDAMLEDYVSAKFNASVPVALVNESLTFTSYSSSSHALQNFTWSFGDGNVTTEYMGTITHSFASVGNYSVCLTAMSDYGVDSFCYEFPVVGEPVSEDSEEWLVIGGILGVLFGAVIVGAVVLSKRR